MSTTTHHRSIARSRHTISAQGQQPLILLLPIWTLQRQSRWWVSKSISSTCFTVSQETMTGLSVWSSWWTEMPPWPPHLMKSSPTSSKRKLQSWERMGSVPKLCSLQRRVAKVVMVVMAVKPVMAAKVQSGIREILRTIGKRRICENAFIANSEGVSPRTAWASNTAILQMLATLKQKHQQKHQLLRLWPCWLGTIWSGQVECFIQLSVHRLWMHKSHLLPSNKDHHLLWTSCEYEEDEWIQWHHTICLRIWKG